MIDFPLKKVLDVPPYVQSSFYKISSCPENAGGGDTAHYDKVANFTPCNILQNLLGEGNNRREWYWNIPFTKNWNSPSWNPTEALTQVLGSNFVTRLSGDLWEKLSNARTLTKVEWVRLPSNRVELDLLGVLL